VSVIEIIQATLLYPALLSLKHWPGGFGRWQISSNEFQFAISALIVWHEDQGPSIYAISMQQQDKQSYIKYMSNKVDEI
jgi:hypothetical protein